MTEILLVANLVVTLLVVMAIGYIWKLMGAMSTVSTYVVLYLDDKFDDFGSKHFEELDE